MRQAIYTLVLLCTLVITETTAAQAPDSIGVQGFVTDDLGNPIDVGPISVRFRLYKGGVSVWEETQFVTINDGLFSDYLGVVTPLKDIPFDEPIELGIKIASDDEISPRTPLVASAFARALPGFYTYYDQDGSDASYNLVGGASNNSISANVIGATISGGGGMSTSQGDAPNVVSSDWGTIAGGLENEVAGSYGTVSGGLLNSADAFGASVGGGRDNHATGDRSSIPGGYLNVASGQYSSIPGGVSNRADGSTSFAGGTSAKAVHDGSFVWSDRSQISNPDDTLTTTGDNQFLIRAAGGVGIGTNNPGGALHVKGDDPTGIYDAQLIIAGTDTTGDIDTGAGLRFDGHDGNVARTWAWIRGLKENDIEGQTGSRLYFATRGGGGLTAKVMINSLGNFMPTVDGSYYLGTSGLAWAGVYADDTTINTSDRRAKHDVEDLHYGLDTIAQLRPISFRWNKRPESGTRLGLIAQEALEVVPEIVDVPEDPDEMLGLRYAELVPVLIKAMQEQQELIDKQDQRIAMLEAALGSQ